MEIINFIIVWVSSIFMMDVNTIVVKGISVNVVKEKDMIYVNVTDVANIFAKIAAWNEDFE